MDENAHLNRIFEEALYERPQFDPADLPMEWEVGKHKYFRVFEDGEETLARKLAEFRELGVRVLDFDRGWGFIVFKTMAPT